MQAGAPAAPEPPAGCDGSQEDSFDQKRKHHYKMDLRAAKAAAAALVAEDDDEEEEEARAVSKFSQASSQASEKNRASSKDSGTWQRQVSDYGHGSWQISPEALHGGPRLGEGFAQSTGGGPALQDSTASASSHALPAASASAGVDSTQQPEALGQVESASASSIAGMPKKGVKWDEETIAEHDLHRGTRQKIEEPKTPWMMGSPGTCSQEEVMHSLTPNVQFQEGDAAPVSPGTTLVEQEVEERLHGWLRKEGHRASIQEQWGEMTGDSPTVPPSAEELSLEEKKARDFAEKRKMHYKVDLKAMRAAVDDDSDEESEESEDEDAATA